MSLMTDDHVLPFVRNNQINVDAFEDKKYSLGSSFAVILELGLKCDSTRKHKGDKKKKCV